MHQNLTPYLFLHGKEIVQRSLIALSPHVPACGAINQLGGDQDAVADRADAAGRWLAWALYAAGFQRSASLFRLAAHSRKYKLMSVRAGIPVSAAIASKYSTVPSSSCTVTSLFSRLA